MQRSSFQGVDLRSDSIPESSVDNTAGHRWRASALRGLCATDRHGV